MLRTCKMSAPYGSTLSTDVSGMGAYGARPGHFELLPSVVGVSALARAISSSMFSPQ
jgi:hypothetical protein